MTTITLRIQVDVEESMKAIAPKCGFAGNQNLLKQYLSEGLRRDESQSMFDPTSRLIEALRKHGVPQAVLDDAARELTSA